MDVEIENSGKTEDVFNIEDHISSMLENVLNEEESLEVGIKPVKAQEQVQRKTKKINTCNNVSAKYNPFVDNQAKNKNFEKYCSNYNPKLLLSSTPFVPKSPLTTSQYTQFYSNLMSPIPFRQDCKRTRTVNHGHFQPNFEFSPEMGAFSTNHGSLVDSYQSYSSSPV